MTVETKTQTRTKTKTRTVAIGWQDFAELRKLDAFYVDKTGFIKEWWENMDQVTLITRPRRFGKTLNLNMVERFFSRKYEGNGEVFEGLRIWEEEEYRKLQGTYPVIFLSFAKVKETKYSQAVRRIGSIISNVFSDCSELSISNSLSEKERNICNRFSDHIEEEDIADSISILCQCLRAHYGEKPIILLDEYDTPMQEAYINGYWDEITNLFRNLFNATFKTNPHFYRAILTGITRVSKESMFSDLNNLEVVTTTSNKYETSFGFTETEVFTAMDEMGLTEKELVKQWYDGYVFGRTSDIYNPWSITNYLQKGEFQPYWANTSSNALAGNLIQSGSDELKKAFEVLINGGTIQERIDEQIDYGSLKNDSAVYSLLVASGYLKINEYKKMRKDGSQANDRLAATLSLTNLESRMVFSRLFEKWFLDTAEHEYNEFVRALLKNDVKLMNIYMNKITLECMSSFDAGKRPAEKEPERFYHGLVLGLLVTLLDRYEVKSNRESGYGRYDVMLIPRDRGKDFGIIIEFKVRDEDGGEDSLEDTVKAALSQIEKKQYETELLGAGVMRDNIRKYGFAFEGKKVLIGAC